MSRLKIVIVDDEPWILSHTEMVCGEFQNIDVVGKFTDPKDCLEFLLFQHADAAILDIEMPVMNGIELGAEIKKNHPDITLIYSTGYDNYALDAFGVNAAAYILKPCSKERMEKAIEMARALAKYTNNPVFVRTFGEFDVFVNDLPIYFKNAKSKELLALLVDKRGSTLTGEQITGYLWEDKLYNDTIGSYLRRAIMNLKQSLAEHSIEDILIDERNAKAVDTQKFVCDYYRLMDGDAEAIALYDGRYMSSYSWAEETTAMIDNKIDFYSREAN